MPHPKILTEKEESAAFFYFLGLTITEWAHVEQSLYWIASLSYPKSTHPQFSTTFFSIENFRSKLLAADRLVKQRKANLPHLERWQTVTGQLEKAAPKRNALAHNLFRSYSKARPGRRFALVPRFSEPSKFKQSIPKAPADAICIGDILDIRHRFFAVGLNIELLYSKMARRKAPLPISHAPEHGALTLEELTRLIRRSLRLQHEPSDP